MACLLLLTALRVVLALDVSAAASVLVGSLVIKAVRCCNGTTQTRSWFIAQCSVSIVPVTCV
ncbi:hypothetical protein KSD_59840 [Ktedonobacter sp. SOSP1-85]|nr:hypothetical protein KSD_49700 [Ktedonobacter sp. SOSP1-85]GHO77378.1 hypothetical protein KSD_51490 [Ktedonobacter sp. SOSP1-85]GHO78213.1 hypothetical protein KSD_59840 [Ktedonobacter sp. SOSP1-85]